jgi:hypothetical protein
LNWITVAICSRMFAQKMAFMRQAGQSKKMAEAGLSFEKRKTITILIQFFSFLKMFIFFGTLCILNFRSYMVLYTHLIFIPFPLRLLLYYRYLLSFLMNIFMVCVFIVLFRCAQFSVLKRSINFWTHQDGGNVFVCSLVLPSFLLLMSVEAHSRGRINCGDDDIGLTWNMTP